MANNRRSAHRKTAATKQPPSPYIWLGLQNFGSLKYLGLVGLIFVSGMSVVYLTHQNRQVFNEIQQLRSEANILDVQWGQLLIEQSTFGLEGRIEQKAIEQLELIVPDSEQLIVVNDD